MKILIIEDEPLAANRLEKLIHQVADNVSVVAKLDSIRDSILFLEQDQGIQLIFADIQLADGLCFEIFNSISVKCPIIFTTAYDQYAIEAFKTNGIDYLLKPIEEIRLKQAIDKFTNLVPQLDLDQLLAITKQFSKTRQSYKSRFIVKVGEHIKTIASEDIKAFYSMEKATFLLTKTDRNFIVDYSLESLDHLLDPSCFFKVNRKHIVSITACTKIVQWSNSRLKIEIQGMENEEVIVARERVQEFKDWLDE